MSKGNRKLKYPIIVHKLEQAFSIGATVREACQYADISPDTFYRWTKNNTMLSDRFDLLREKPILKARMAVVGSFEERPEIALKYLERKKRKEFGLKIGLDGGEDGKPIQNEIKVTFHDFTDDGDDTK